MFQSCFTQSLTLYYYQASFVIIITGGSYFAATRALYNRAMAIRVHPSREVNTERTRFLVSHQFESAGAV